MSRIDLMNIAILLNVQPFRRLIMSLQIYQPFSELGRKFIILPRVPIDHPFGFQWRAVIFSVGRHIPKQIKQHI